jgi:hypothetical protein
MLCLADRNFLGYQLWQQARSTGADLLWRAKQSSPFDALETYEDGYYLSFFSHPEVRRRGKAGQEVPVIDYQTQRPKPPSRSIGLSHRFWIHNKLRPINWRLCMVSAGN